jgi:hypothetical protein
MIYLASPYSHPKVEIVQARFRAACRATAKLMAQGHHVFSPIAHSHMVAMIGDLRLAWEFWSQIDYEWIRLCGCVWVLALSGWKESVGVQAELCYARGLQLPEPRILSPEELGIPDVVCS